MVNNRLHGLNGKLTSVTVAVDAGEWIRSRLSKEEISSKLRSETGTQVRVVPVRLGERLLHAKAFAVLHSTASEKGFVVATSGNATGRGIGLAKSSNVELCVCLSEPRALADFKALFSELLCSEVSDQYAIEQDRFLRALALFSSGAFFHHWSGALAPEVRFRHTLTAVGRKARGESRDEFRGYDSDADTISKDWLDIESVFEKTPKPFPSSFWRTYSLNTLLGYWAPKPIVELVDHVMGQSADPYINAIREKAMPRRLGQAGRSLLAEIRQFNDNGWVKIGNGESPDLLVEKWKERVEAFSRDADLIKMRIHPYSKKPDLLDSSKRGEILKAIDDLKYRLGKKRVLSGTRAVANTFLFKKATLADLNKEILTLSIKAKAALEKHEQ